MIAPRRVAIALTAAVGALTSPGHAGDRPEPAGEIVFARDGSLWRLAVDGGEPRELAKLPDADVEVRALETSADGRLIVADLGGVAAWVQPGGRDDDVRAVAVAPCTGPGRPAADGRRLFCPGRPGTTVIQPVAWKARAIDVAGALAFFGPHGDELVVADGASLRAVAAADPARTRALAPHRPTSHLLVAPNGERAVGRYEQEDDVAVYAFRLDGEAARRKLGGDLTPVAWSRDSEWVLFAHDRRACLARAVGGEYKCWERYGAVAISADSRHVLLSRKGALYTAPIAGVEPKRPRRLLEHDGPAAWLK